MTSLFSKLGSIASSLVSSKAKIPYDIQDEIGRNGLWRVHKASKDEEKFTAFIFDKKRGRNRLEEELALNEVKKLRALRHPGVVHYVFHHEDEEKILVVCEELTLLNLKEETEVTKLFGCYNILKALSFLHSNYMYHFQLNPDAIFVDKKKMWKLGSLGFLTKIEDNYKMPTEFPSKKFSQVMSKRYPLYRAPEVNMKKWEFICRYPHSVDIFSFAVLLFDVFEGASIDHVDQILRSQLRNLPKSLRRNCMRQLLQSNPSKRPTVEELLKNGAFKNHIFNLFEFVERVPVEQDPNVLETNLSNLWTCLDKFPRMYCQYRILPQLFHALLFGAGQVKKNVQHPQQTLEVVQPQLKIYQIVFRIGSAIEDSNVYRKIMIPSLYKILCSTDTMPIYHQIKVVEQLNQVVPHAEPEFLKNKIFPIVLNGLCQTRSSNLREASVKSVVTIVPVLDLKSQIMEKLVPAFFNLQKDQKKSVRANAVIAVGMMTPHLVKKGKEAIDNFVLPFFARTLKYDNFAYSKIYSLKALKTTLGVYDFVQLCRTVVPIVAPWLISRNADIRDSAYECFKESVLRIRNPFDGGKIEDVLNKELGFIAPVASSGEGAGAGASENAKPSGHGGRLKTWASTLFLGKEAMQVEEKKKLKKAELKVQKEKKMEKERKWMEDRKKREMEELRKNERARGSSRTPNMEEDDEDEDYVNDFFKNSPSVPKPKIEDEFERAASYNSTRSMGSRRNDSGPVYTTNDEPEENEDWEIGWGAMDVEDDDDDPSGGERPKVFNDDIKGKNVL